MRERVALCFAFCITLGCFSSRPATLETIHRPPRIGLRSDSAFVLLARSGSVVGGGSCAATAAFGRIQATRGDTLLLSHLWVQAQPRGAAPCRLGDEAALVYAASPHLQLRMYDRRMLGPILLTAAASSLAWIMLLAMAFSTS